MSCGAGYPKEPCPFKHEGAVTRKQCGACIHYKPPRHILSWCMLYERTKELCMLPRAACDTCKEKAPMGRVAADVDWKDPVSVRAYWKEQARKHPDSRIAAMQRFLEKDPDYFKRYYKANQEKMREASRRSYLKRKALNADGSGEAESNPRGPGSERHENLSASRPDDDV